MIVKVNFNDNDFGQYFVDFFKQFKYVTYYECIRQLSKEEQELHRNIITRQLMAKIYDKVFYNPEQITNEDKRAFEEFVKESVLAFMKDKVDANTLDYLNRNITVKLQKTYKDEWENGETVYYIIGHNIVILQ